MRSEGIKRGKAPVIASATPRQKKAKERDKKKVKNARPSKIPLCGEGHGFRN